MYIITLMKKSHIVLKGGLSLTLSYLFRTVRDFSWVGACRFQTEQIPISLTIMQYMYSIYMFVYFKSLLRKPI